MKTLLKEIGPVQFPEHTGERIYMLPFKMKDGLPKHLARWQATIDSMLFGIRTNGFIFLMIDQGEVRSGQTHRRSGVHIDGNWITEMGRHGHTKFGRWGTGGGQHTNDQLSEEALILASDVEACRAYVGEFEGEIKQGGDCSHIDLCKVAPVMLKPNVAYMGNVTMLHESVPVKTNCNRTLVRLNLPGVTF